MKVIFITTRPNVKIWSTSCQLAAQQSAQRLSFQVLSRRFVGSMTKSIPRPSAEKLRLLHEYSACDVSDALLKLQKPQPGEVARGGYLTDIIPFAPTSLFAASESQPKIIAPASTLKLIPKSSSTPSLPESDLTAVPKGAHWVDMTDEGTVVVIDQPEGQSCAAIGGIMANRMQKRGVVGCIVGGRVRDLAELKNSGLPVWASGKSTVGTGAEAKVLARNCPISIRGVPIAPGDIIFCDPLEGVVVLPYHLLDEALSLMPKLVQADDKVKEDVLNGSTVFDAFKKHRS